MDWQLKKSDGNSWLDFISPVDVIFLFWRCSLNLKIDQERVLNGKKG